MYAKPFLKRVLVVMLALSLLVPQSLLTVQADSSTIYVHDSKAYDNPAFSEPLRKQNREDFSDGIKETPVSTLLAGSSSKNGEYCTTNEAVSNRIREFLVKREENYSIKVRLKIGNVKDSEKEDTLTKLMSSLFNAAFAETDKGYEGDYLEQILQGYDAQAAGLWEDGTFIGTFSYFSPLFTSAAQEKKVTEKVKKILADLRISEIHDEYQKIRLIYDYICQNTVYDFERMNTNPPYTAYGVLVEGKGVCAGFAHAIYRIAKEAGLACRIINASSTKKGEAGHAWNIVRIGNLYYYLDATWDLDNKKQGKPYGYFLKKTPFVDHGASVFIVSKNDDFWKKHPLSTRDYPYKDAQPESESLEIPIWPQGNVERKGISLYWETEPEVTRYEIFRSSDGMKPVRIGTSTSGKYTDTKVKSGRYYTYFLKAVSGNKTSALSEGSIFCFLTPPANLHVRSVGRRIATLTWKTVNGATGYQIRYGTNKSFKSSKQITIKSRKTLQKVIRRLQKKTYYFQIRAIKKNGSKNFCSAWSKTVSCPVK